MQDIIQKFLDDMASAHEAFNTALGSAYDDHAKNIDTAREAFTAAMDERLRIWAGGAPPKLPSTAPIVVLEIQSGGGGPA